MRDQSVLGNMLPEGLIFVLDNYGYQRFVDVFLGNADTPEVIWTMEMRKYLIEMIRQHLGDFPFRLFQNNTLEYEYCPIPAVSYRRLQSELFCHNYYLHNLCDEERFPDWPIAEPMEVLKSCLREFQNKTENSDDSSESREKARRLLELQDGDGSKELRRAYRTQARLYHPDKNPAGRDRFEAIQKAYEVLLPIVESGEKIQSYSSGTESDLPYASGPTEGLTGGLNRMKTMHLLIRTQLLIYRRFENVVSQVKYPSYSVLLECLKLPASCEVMANEMDTDGLLASCFVREERAELIRHGVELIYRTCLVSPLNADELVSQGGVQILAQLLRVTTRTLEALSGLGERAPLSRASYLATTEHIVRTLGGVAFYERGRDCISSLADISGLLIDWKLCVDGSVANAAGVQDNSVRLYALEGIVNLAKVESLQMGLVEGGILWPLLRLLLCFDPTVEASQASDDKADFSIHSMNLLANAAVRALGAISGLLPESPRNEALTNALDALLTQPMAKLLRNSRTEETLRIFNTNVEEPYLIWNVAMRQELEQFVNEIEKSHSPYDLRDVDEELSRARSFRFQALKEEFVVGGVYIRVFLVKGKEALAKIDNIWQFSESLLAFLARLLNESNLLSEWGKIPMQGIDKKACEMGTEPSGDIAGKEFSMSLNAIRMLVKISSDDSLAETSLFVSTILALLEVPLESEAFDVGCDILSVVSPKMSFANVVAREGALWRVVLVLEKPHSAEDSTEEGQSSLESDKRQSRAWSVLEALSSSSSIAKQLVNSTGWLELLGVLVGYTPFSKAWTSRLGAAKTLSRLLWDPSTGTTVGPLLHRFLPLSLTVLLKEEPEAMVKSFDDETDSPELIWDSSMRAELRGVVASELDSYLSQREQSGPDYSVEFNLSPGVQVRYAKLEGELYVGGVYVSRFLKDPTYKLRDPTGFLEALLQRWVKELHLYIEVDEVSTHSETTDLANARQSALQIITKAVIFVCKVRESLCDKLAEWGYIPRAIAILDRVLKRDLLGTPLVALIRLLHVAADRMANVEAVASVTDHDRRSGIVDSIIRAIGRETLHPDSSFMVETLLKTYKVALGDIGKAAVGATIPYGGNIVMAPSPASDDGPVRCDPHLDIFIVAMAPSPAPGEGPVQRSRERVSLGDDPLAMFGGSLGPNPAPSPNGHTGVNAAPPQQAAVTTGFSPIQHRPQPQQPSAHDHRQPLGSPSYQGWNQNQTPGTTHPSAVHQAPHIPLRSVGTHSTVASNPLHRLHATDPLGMQHSPSGQSSSLQPTNRQPNQSNSTVVSAAGPSHYQNSRPDSFAQPQTNARQTTPQHNSAPASSSAATGFAVDQRTLPTTSSDRGPDPALTSSHSTIPHQRNETVAASWQPSAGSGEDVFSAQVSQPPQQNSFNSPTSSLGANSFNRPPSTVLDNAPVSQNSDRSSFRFNDDDDDSSEFSPQMTLFGTNPLPIGSSSSVSSMIQDSSISAVRSHSLQQTLPGQGALAGSAQEVRTTPQETRNNGYGTGPSLETVDEHNIASRATDYVDRPISMHGNGIDARSPQDPKITAQEQAMTMGGARGAANGRVALLQQALACNLCPFLVNDFLEHPKLASIRDPSAAKVHAIALLKLLCSDPGYGPKFKLILEELPAWKKYSSQDHSLLIASSSLSSPQNDYFLTDGGATSEAKLLTHK